MYSRFEAIQGFSDGDQERIEDSVAAVIGLGATGSAIAENMARHGVKLILIDRDYLEEKDVYSSNLYTPDQCSRSLPKAEAAKQHLEDFTEVESRCESLEPDNIDILKDADIVMDGTDNLKSRKVLANFSKKHGVPWVYTAAVAEKTCSAFFSQKCFSCVVDSGRIATCETDGIMREAAQIAAARSAWKAIRYLCGKKVDERIEYFPSGRKLEFEESECKVCQGQSFPALESSSEPLEVCGESKYQLEAEYDREKLVEVLDVESKNEYLVRGFYQESEIVFFDSGRVIVEAEDEGHAKALLSEVAGF